MTKKQKQILRFSKIVIIIVIIMVLIFTGFILYVFYKKGTEPTVIIASFFTFMTGEVLALAKLKLAEIKEEDKLKKKDIEEKENGNSL